MKKRILISMLALACTASPFYSLRGYDASLPQNGVVYVQDYENKCVSVPRRANIADINQMIQAQNAKGWRVVAACLPPLTACGEMVADGRGWIIFGRPISTAAPQK